MTKRRTRKEKIKARHNNLISWNPEAKTNNSEANVKRQLKNASSQVSIKQKKNKLAVFVDKNETLASVRKDVVKSLTFAFLIVASEIVIYLIWFK